MTQKSYFSSVYERVQSSGQLDMCKWVKISLQDFTPTNYLTSDIE